MGAVNLCQGLSTWVVFIKFCVVGPSLADQMPWKSQAEELEVSEARGAHGAQEWDLTGPGDRRW